VSFFYKACFIDAHIHREYSKFNILNNYLVKLIIEIGQHVSWAVVVIKKKSEHFQYARTIGPI